MRADVSPVPSGHFGLSHQTDDHALSAKPSVAELERLIAARQYPGLAPSDVSTPFMLFGALNLKTGRVTLKKMHYKYVFNTIEYTGIVRGFTWTGENEEQEAPASQIFEELVAKLSGTPTRQQRQSIDVLSLDLRSECSAARVALVPIEEDRRQEMRDEERAETDRTPENDAGRHEDQPMREAYSSSSPPSPNKQATQAYAATTFRLGDAYPI
jgi:hypothetical protein